MSRLNRRDFLKFGSMLSGAFALSPFATRLSDSASTPNILIFVFDAMSAKNLSVYGYHRNTTPNLERFAQHATVFNQHYSTANFTTPGTASLLTGLYPWTHRAIIGAAPIARNLASQNLFHALGPQVHRLAFSQNVWANYLFEQFRQNIETVLPPDSFSLLSAIVGHKISGDVAESQRAFDDFLFRERMPPPALIFGLAERFMLRRSFARTPAEDYPNGLPRVSDYPIFFRLSEVFDGMRTTVEQLKPPFMAYLHTWSPHDPYRASPDFRGRFVDGWSPVLKPDHLLSDHMQPSDLAQWRRNYDRYVADVDFEFGRLLEALSAKGILDNSYVVVTSDHGEMFERGVRGHVTPLLYESIVRVPLLISDPGQVSRHDVNVPTSSIDVLPTLVHLAGGEVPGWCEGQVLPGLGGAEVPEQSIYMMDARENTAFGPLIFASFAFRKGPYKLLYYKGFPQFHHQDTFELYDISSDPEELNDLYPQSPAVAADMRTELLAKVAAVNANFKG